MKTITISGGFHARREMTVRAQEENGAISLSVYQLHRIDRHMCGIKGCICGMRGWEITGASHGDLANALQEAQVAEFSQQNSRI